MAISIAGDGIAVACMKRVPSAMPVLESMTFYPSDKSPVALHLERLAKEQPVDRFQCSTMLANGDYHLLSVEAPNVPPDELKAAIRWRLKDLLDFPVDDATVDVVDVPVDKNAANRSHSMYAVVARNQLIKQRQADFAAAKIPLQVIDIPEMAQRNFSALLEPEGRGIAMLSFDVSGGLLTVTFGGELYLSRRIDVPLAQLEQSDADARSTCHDRITLELQRSLDHCDRQYHFIAIAKLVLAPFGHAAVDLKAYLSSNLYIPVDMLDLAATVDIAKAPELQSAALQQRFFLTLGAALRVEETVL